MQLALRETDALLRDALQTFLKAECGFERVREHERARRADLELWRAFCAQGYVRAPFAAELGGGDGGFVTAGVLVEECARRAALLPVVEVLASALVLRRARAGAARCSGPHGRRARAPDAFARALLAQTLSGEALPVPAFLEARDDFDAIETTADATGALTGEKFFVDYGDAATHHLVVAREPHNADALALYSTPRADAQLTCAPLLNMGRTPQSRVRYDGARGVRVAGADGVAALLAAARALTCAQLLACMTESLAQTVAYTNVRKQFGRTLASFQAVQQQAADMAIHVESSRFLTYETLDALERGTATDEQVALTKASLSRALPEVVMTGHQLHGGQGFIEENDLYFFTLRGKDRSLAWGSAEECLGVVARSVEEKARWL